MASPSLLRSAAVRVLRRPSLQVPSGRSPRVFFSGVAGKIEPCKGLCSNRNCTEGVKTCRFDMVLNQFEAYLHEARSLVQVILEQEKRAQQNAQLQKKIACVLLPATAAIWIFVPNKKEKSSAEELPADSL
ncbi:hypothetical protein QYE76_025825 [Lolium multiflorum]|uniref:Uncharacterized protein n=1 Tax=Lolium multiflorum TaxID=4521 RepID=A0AAD8RJC5_LOLMU|nr:hypothetical protein QYE76_025825 [Lolium multiflorum]